VDTSIALSRLVGSKGRLVGFVKLDLEADRTVIDLGGDRQVGYPNSVLVHATNTARMHVPEPLVPNMRRASRGKWLTCQVTSLSGSSRMETG
jgi:hypothetical protein